MEVDYMMSRNITNTTKEGGGGDDDDDDDVPLPGFRFHPTDEELVGFYLRRKVEKKLMSIELIKQADIYKYDPWDLPKSSNVGDKEWYFFCRRGRKYKNSIRPNRVTGSGFWKATGIDRPIYSGDGRSCIIGLKKSLVYYRGSAGKGTKTEWMMHEFRLPTNHDNKSTKDMDARTIAQEAEVWTLCRILKRTASYRKCTPEWREVAPAKRCSVTNPAAIDHAAASSETCSVESCDQNGQIISNYISFSGPMINTPTTQYQEKKPYSEATANEQMINLQGNFSSLPAISHHHQEVPSTASSLSSPTMCGDINELLRNADWEDLRSIVGAYGAAASSDPSISPSYQ